MTSGPVWSLSNVEIKLRARRRIGEISKTLEKGTGRPSKKIIPGGGKNSKRDTLKAAGISTSAAQRCEKIADIPEKTFEDFTAGTPAKNTEAERRACEIRLRAERKAGQLRKQEQKAKGFNAMSPPPQGGRTPTNEERRSQLGISKKQDEQWQALAGVPDEEFEAALGSDKKPSTSGIIAKPRKMPATSLWLWGRLSPKFSISKSST